ncbi:MAG: thioredoxin domain-containing protein [Bacteroidota bacterium]|nr:thioredoxin domain-containing protein [Bacteroidota bacterium]
MIKYIFIRVTLIFSILISLSTSTWAQGIKFEEGSFADIKKLSRTSNKYIFIDCYTKWCGPCKVMARDVFTQDTIAQFYNKNFVCYKSDMEEGEGREIARTYSIAFYPTMMILDSTGKMVHKIVGGKNTMELLAEGEISLDPNRNLSGQILQFRKGKSDTAFLRKLMLATYQIEPEVQKEISKAYFAQIKKTDIIRPEIYPYFRDMETDVLSETFVYVYKNSDQFVKVYGEDATNNLQQKLFASLDNFGRAGNEISFMKVTEYFINDTSKLKKMMGYQFRSIYYVFHIDQDKLVKSLDEWYKYAKNNNDELNKMSTLIWEKTDNKKALEKGASFLDRSYFLNKDYNSAMLAANMYLKIGDKKTALARAKEAQRYGKEQKIDINAADNMVKDLSPAK